MTPAVFLDRDGTMVHDVGYLGRAEDLRWYPWTIDAIRLLNRAGFTVCVTTNQGGVGLGLFTIDFVEELHAGMDRTIAAAGGRVDGWFYCPHHPRAVVESLRFACQCRKPEPGMLVRASLALGIDLSASFVVGDKQSDTAMAARVGARGVLVRTGYGIGEIERHGTVAGAEYVADNLMEATSWILAESGPSRR